LQFSFEPISGDASKLWDRHLDFLPMYQFSGYGVNEYPGTGQELGGVARPSAGLKCVEPCYTFNEIKTDKRCGNDCDCNGDRWCSHLGECTGEAKPCRADGEFKSASVTPTVTATTATQTTTTQGPTTTTTLPPLSRLTIDCYKKVVDLWRPCEIGVEVTGCPGIACAVTHSFVVSGECAVDLCPKGSVQGPPIAMDYWFDQCQNAQVRQDYTVKRTNCYPTTTSTTTNFDKVVNESAASSAGSLHPLVWISVVFAFCCLGICVVRACLSARVKDFVRSTYERLKLSSRARSNRSAKGKRKGKPGMPARHSTIQMEEEKAARSWSTHFVNMGKVPSGGTKVVDVPDDDDDDTTDSSPGLGPKGAEKPSTGGSGPGGSEGGAGGGGGKARTAWEEGRSDSNIPGGAGAAGPGPRIAAAAAFTPVQNPTTASDALLAELRRLRTNDHSAAERRRFFREQLLKYHPDKNIGEEDKAAEMFKVLQDNKAWFLNED